MSAGWVAASVRARALARRHLRQPDADALAASPSLGGALSVLSAGPYGRSVRADMDLTSARRGISAALLWHARIVAGWGPPLRAGSMQALAGGFEIANIVGHLARLQGADVPTPYELGSLSTAWPRVRGAESAAEVRAVLATTAWGDPGSDDAAVMALGLNFGWARRVAAVPGATQWGTTGAVLVAARVIAAEARAELGPGARRDATRVLGSAWEEVSSLEDLVRVVPGAAGPAAARLMKGVSGRDDLWRAEVRWWTELEAGAARLARGRVSDEATGVGVIGQMAAHAWRTKVALELAARGGRTTAEMSDVLA